MLMSTFGVPNRQDNVQFYRSQNVQFKMFRNRKNPELVALVP